MLCLPQDCTYLPTANNSVCPICAISSGQTKHPIVTTTVFGDHWSDHQTALSAQTQSKWENNDTKCHFETQITSYIRISQMSLTITEKGTTSGHCQSLWMTLKGTVCTKIKILYSPSCRSNKIWWHFVTILRFGAFFGFSFVFVWLTLYKFIRNHIVTYSSDNRLAIQNLYNFLSSEEHKK